MEFDGCVGAKLEEMSLDEQGGSTGHFSGRMGRRKYRDGDDSQYKSKNLTAERKRREKLSQRLLALRSLVPIITNMNKVTIIEDAVTYIKELQKNVEVLSDQLMEMEASSFVEDAKAPIEETGPAEAMEESGIQPDVKVINIDRNKLWVKIIFEKRRGRLTKLMEALGGRGFQLIDISVTTSMGATLVSSCIEGTRGELLEASSMRKVLEEIIDCI